MSTSAAWQLLQFAAEFLVDKAKQANESPVGLYW